MTSLKTPATEEEIKQWRLGVSEQIKKYMKNDKLANELENDGRRCFNLDVRNFVFSLDGKNYAGMKVKDDLEVDDPSKYENFANLLAFNAAGEQAPILSVYKEADDREGITSQLPQNINCEFNATGEMDSKCLVKGLNHLVDWVMKQNIKFPIICYVSQDFTDKYLGPEMMEYCDKQRILVFSILPNAPQPTDFIYPHFMEMFEKLSMKCSEQSKPIRDTVMYKYGQVAYNADESCLPRRVRNR